MQYTLYVIVRCFDSCHRPVGKQRHRDLCETPSSHGFNQPSWPWKAVDCHTLLIAARAEVDHLKRRLSQVNLMWLGWFPWFPWVFSVASAVPDGRNMRPVDVMHRVSGKKLVLLEPRNVKHMVAQARVQLTLFFLRNYCGRVYLLNSDDIPEHIGDFLELWSALGLLLRIQANTVQKKKTNAKNTSLFEEKHKQKQNKNQTTILKTKNNKRKTKQNKTKQIQNTFTCGCFCFLFFPFFFFRRWPGDQDLRTCKTPEEKTQQTRKKSEQKTTRREHMQEKSKQTATTYKCTVYWIFFWFCFYVAFFLVYVFCLAFSCAVLIVFCSKSGLDWVFCFSLIFF